MVEKLNEVTLNVVTKFPRPNKSVCLKMGLVGLPNVGKSSLFNAFARMNVRADNFAFCTKDPHVGHVKIKDERLDFLVDIFKPKSIINATLEIIDIAGLVKGSSEGLGLGNQFLDNIRNVDGIFMVVRCFEDKEITHYEGDVNPLRDIDIIFEELRLKDAKQVDKAKLAVEKELRGDSKNKKIVKNLATCDKLLKTLESKLIINVEWDKDEKAFINSLCLLTTKVCVILANISVKNFTEKKVNKHLGAVIRKYGAGNVVGFSALHLNEEGYLDDSMVKKLVNKGYDSLDLANFFTAGKDEVRSWTIRKGMTAPEAGGVIHTDFEKYFISSDVVSFDDFKACGSLVKSKEAGKYTQKGKTYVVQSGDIILFKSNPPRKK